MGKSDATAARLPQVETERAGPVRRCVAKMTGLSRAQATRLLGMYLRGEKVQSKPYRRRRFAERYTRCRVAADRGRGSISVATFPGRTSWTLPGATVSRLHGRGGLPPSTPFTQAALVKPQITS
jgi:hypothetical protein